MAIVLKVTSPDLTVPILDKPLTHATLKECKASMQSIYNEYINKPYIERLYLTEIADDYDGDTYFPILPHHFNKVSQGKALFYQKNALEFSTYNFNVYSNYLFDDDEYF